MYNFDEILDRKKNNTKKWNREYIQKRFKDAKEPYYPLFIADMDYRLPEEINKGFIDIVSRGDFGYFDIKDEFKSDIKNWYKVKQSLDVNLDDIVPIVGALTTMNVILGEVLNYNDKVLVFTPVYGPFKDITLNNGLELIKEPLEIKEDRYFINFERLSKKINDENIKCILLCNPHNPSGRIWNTDELERILEIAKKNNVLVISDEVHGDLALYNNSFSSIYKLKEKFDNYIVIGSPNKTFNIASLNVGYALISNVNLKDRVCEGMLKRKIHLNILGAEFSSVCYKNGYLWVKELIEKIEKNIELVNKYLRHIDCNIMIPDAGYLIWVKFNKIDDSLKFSVDLAKETGVLLECGNRFIDDYKGFLRINVATNSSILEEAMKKILDFYNEI